MMWTLAKACLVISGIIAMIWLLQAFGLVALIEDPAADIIFFGLIGVTLAYLVKRYARKAGQNGVHRS